MMVGKFAQFLVSIKSPNTFNSHNRTAKIGMALNCKKQLILFPYFNSTENIEFPSLFYLIMHKAYDRKKRPN